MALCSSELSFVIVARNTRKMKMNRLARNKGKEEIDTDFIVSLIQVKLTCQD